MNLEIRSDGRPLGTTIIDPETQRDYSGLAQGVEFQHRAGGLPEVTVQLVNIIARLEGVARWYLPGVGHIRAVEMEDGKRVTMEELFAPHEVDTEVDR